MNHSKAAAAVMTIVVVLAAVILLSRFTRAVEVISCLREGNDKARVECIQREATKQMRTRFF